MGKRSTLRKEPGQLSLPGLTAAAQSSGTFTASGQPGNNTYFDVGDARYHFRSSVNHANSNEVQIGSDIATTVANMGRGG